jgi:uncharacterized protein
MARLDELLEALNADASMMLEELDGFVASNVCGPQPVESQVLLPWILGLQGDEQPRFESPAQRDELLALIDRHQASVQDALGAGEGFAPIMMHDEQGKASGNLWAIGFLRGISLCAKAWEPIDDDEALSGLLEPFEVLAEELDMETGEVTAPVPEEDRQGLIDHMIEASFEFYEFFEPARERQAQEMRRH